MQEKSPFDAAHYQDLADKWVQGTLSPAERKELEDWYNAGQDLPVQLPPGFAASEAIQERQMLQAIREKAGLACAGHPCTKKMEDHSLDRGRRVPAGVSRCSLFHYSPEAGT